MHFEISYEFSAGSADVPVRSADRRDVAFAGEEHFALRAQCGRDVRVPSKIRPQILKLHHNLPKAKVHGTILESVSYIEPDDIERAKISEIRKMKEAGDILRLVGIVLLVLFVLAVGVPLVLAAAGVALGIIGILVGLAIALIKIAIVVAIIYLIIVGIRAVLR